MVDEMTEEERRAGTPERTELAIYDFLTEPASYRR